ncbi:CobW family GTP-binding protein [Marinobacter salexigens]|uniref:GTP-binding protein n=1 Tax=Marinobacter salexigens TaxID=1925763 RepID=A0ABS6A7B5_9GAMM|nr:GTP-binding protein [Marinobacter salexigens]MBU2874080.1 GTP-binding protein [Marinobacter salexigens]
MKIINKEVPVTIVSGFLGSGKTTLLNRILNGKHGLKIAVMVNDFGEINIDSQLIVSAEQNVMSLANGCICCTVESDLIEQLDVLLNLREGRPDYILIETSGVSDPGRVVHTLRYPRFREKLRIDSVICMLDAEQFSSLPAEVEQLAMRQLEVADIVVINKADLSSEEKINDIKANWLFPSARVYETSFAEIPFDLLIGVDEFSEKDGYQSVNHGKLFSSFKWETNKPLSLKKLRVCLSNLPSNVYRVKGIVSLDAVPDQYCTVHMVGTRISIEKLSGLKPSGDASRLIIIGFGFAEIDDIKEDLSECVVCI